MKNIIIDLISKAKRDEPSYKAGMKTLSKLHNFIHFSPESEKELFANILKNNSDDDSIIFTFLAHGGQSGLSNNFDLRVSYVDIFNIAGTVRTRNKVIINFLANCVSEQSLKHLPANHSIDEVWYTSQETISIDKAIRAAAGGFQNFYDLLDINEQTLYQRRELTLPTN